MESNHDKEFFVQDLSLPEITFNMIVSIETTFVVNDHELVIASKFGLIVKQRDLRTLMELNWVNDEIINFYMNLLVERSRKKYYPRVHAMNIFFYHKLLSDGYASVKRWTKNVDIFTQDIVAVPIHLTNHWSMLIIDFQKKLVNYYDSMGFKNQECLMLMRQYLENEHLDKKRCPVDLKDWVFQRAINIPKQTNGYDCGIFSCVFAEHLCARRDFSFTQKDIPYFRNKMMYEIITMKLL